MNENFVVCHNGPFDVEVRPVGEADQNVIVRAAYHATLDTIGWDTLEIETDGDFPDDQQAHAAGFFEGFATAFRIIPHSENLPHFQPVTPEVAASLTANMEWLDANLPELAEGDEYWSQVSLLWQYFNGMFAGILASGYEISRERLFQVASLPDVQSIDTAFKAERKQHPEWRTMNKVDFEAHFHDNTYCSALFKLSEDREELYFGHCTWIFWPWMARIFKRITLNYNLPSNNARTITMSSWAGAMSSYDDFYLTSAGLTALETTFSILNENLWYEAGVGRHPDKLTYWMRAMVANRMATDGATWVDIFSRNNGGTYNNEWYILDRNRFVPGEEPAEGLLTVANQVPTEIRSQDMSAQLATGHVASYNVPVINEIYQLTGYPEAVAKHGPEMLSYDHCVRARIFERDQHKVTDLDAMKYMMQYNDYMNDPISAGNPMYAIASRGDLQAVNPKAFGAIDAKVSTITMAADNRVAAFSGPTPQQGPFSFDTPGVDVGPHKGLPVRPVFDWQEM